MDEDASSTPLSPRTGAGLVLTRTRSQEAIYASTAPYAHYPPDIAVQQLRQQMGQAVDAQSSRLDTVQQAVGAQSQQTYEQLMVLHQQQQLQANAQMELNQKLMAELALQRLRLRLTKLVTRAEEGPYHQLHTEGGKCFKCLSTGHNVFKCPKVADGEARLLMDRAKAIWAEARGEGKDGEGDNHCQRALDASFDSGAHQSVIPPKTLQMLKDAGRDVVVTDLPTPVVVREVKLPIKFEADVGSLVLAKVKCWLSVGNLPAGVGDILLSRPIMHKLGCDPQSKLREAAAVCSEYDMKDVESTSGVVKTVMLATKQELVDDLAEEEEALVPMELAASKVQAVLDARVADALLAGCGAEFALGLSKLLAKYMDVFRLTLGRDPPVDMPPLKVHPTKNSKPVRCKAGRYSLPQREFMQKHVEELENAGFIYRNPTSRWACALLIVRKPHTLTGRSQQPHGADCLAYAHVGSCGGPPAWSHLLFMLDFFKGYWKFSLDLSCQEMFSFLRDTGVYTSNRVMQGVRDLTIVLKRVFSAVGRKRTNQLTATLLLTDVGWNDTHVAALEATKKVLAKVVELSHPKPEMRLFITQVPPDQLNLQFEAQSNEPLMFLSGTFMGAAGRWAIVEKEAYAIVETLVRADYLLHPAAGFNLYSDHRNLKFIFNPTAAVASVPKYTAQKLESWALQLMGYRYEIHDIPGADLLSRWGSPLKPFVPSVKSH
ncbi:hypothetical protein H257_13188 [Aphanomyces astaci]|uniref:Reverse transcriptase RNase H-like domain-containing protein n=1 Tax=Aphanomyces astaci TaxID=112090 RepID=W4FVI8_APHAT|nr:hypothetical protein H257_13188 [Aphanomyces astaci]ETV71525.1 hypothetical protein H257_13188 [Aphanomyces astaci]|eukprot:XP_009838958.1 hypothetical protein H257_13188 [Aphanomyces astaci]